MYLTFLFGGTASCRFSSSSLSPNGMDHRSNLLLINDYFQQYGNVYFISLIRNPYFTRHNIIDWYQDANYVKHNIEHFDNLLHITYE